MEENISIVVAMPNHRRVLQKLAAINTPMTSSRNVKSIRFKFRNRLGNHDELKYLCNELGISNHSSGDEAWVTTRIVNQSIFWKDNEVSLQQIPDVRGMTLRDAIYVLENLGLKVSTEGRGRVAEQSQVPGRKLSKGSRITLTLS